MKIKLLIFCLSPLILFFISCKKESTVTIVGQWRSVSVYTVQDNGTYNWVQVDNHPQFYNFSTEGTFGSATDVPGRSGSYNYDETLQELTLHYEADRYGNIPGAASLKVERLDRDKLILTYSSSGNFIYKTEYSRIN
jgi:hypothetical protein